ncbi:hypothetical protein CRM22_005503 [Opisthorchis felineus]|uniref:Uncharacterized protein n=1 Tax=Opisthorchis felineus TaxID=147828 RepID=A0A4S2LQW6_OPIFE|nr:hypothetical protein CRM22_005503 [Opisthorchis felineus]
MIPRLSTTNRQQSLETEYYHGDSMAPKKNRQNDRQAICFLYAASVVAASLSIAVASMKYSDTFRCILLLDHSLWLAPSVRARKSPLTTTGQPSFRNLFAQ